MAILANPNYFEMDRAGEIDQILVAVRYTGPQRRYSNRSAATQGLWPDYTSFLQDQWYVGFVPESVPEGVSAAGIAWFERNEHFEVEFDAAVIADILLDRNYVSLEPGGPIGENDVVADFDAKVHDALGLEPPAVAGARYEEQLAELAGRDDPEAEVDDEVSVTELISQFTRAELKAGVAAVHADPESLGGRSMHELAALLIDHVEDPVRVVMTGEYGGELVGAASDEEASNEGDFAEPEAVEPPFDPSDHTVSELGDALDGADHSAAELTALREAEASGEDRTTALDAIDDALEAVE